VEILGNARFSVTQPADAVLVAGTDGKVIALGSRSRGNAEDLWLDFEFANLENATVASMFPWKGVIAADAVPDGVTTLDFWALDVTTRSVARMQARLKVDKAAKKVEIVTD